MTSQAGAGASSRSSPVKATATPLAGAFSADRGAAEGVDVGGQRLGRAGLHGRDGDEAGAGGEVEHPLAGDDLRMVEQVARQRLAAGPGEGPERRRQADLGQRLLGQLPERGDLVGQVEPISGACGTGRKGACWRG